MGTRSVPESLREHHVFLCKVPARLDDIHLSCSRQITGAGCCLQSPHAAALHDDAHGAERAVSVTWLRFLIIAAAATVVEVVVVVLAMEHYHTCSSFGFWIHCCPFCSKDCHCGKYKIP